MTETVTEYGVRLPDGHVEADWVFTLDDARDDAAERPGAVVVMRQITYAEWTEVSA